MEITAANVWMMVSAALVLLMTPALGLFYGGMTRAKASLNMIMMSFVSAGIVGVVWVLWGYSMSTGKGVLGLFGNPFASFGLSALIGSPDLIKAGFSRHLRDHHRRPDQRRDRRPRQVHRLGHSSCRSGSPPSTARSPS